jgi:hypothetical protein
MGQRDGDTIDRLGSVVAHPLAHRALATAEAMLVDQPLVDPVRGVALLARTLEVVRQPLLYHLCHRVHDRRRPRCHPPVGPRSGIFQHFANRLPAVVEGALQLPQAQSLAEVRVPNTLDLSHFGHSSLRSLSRYDTGTVLEFGWSRWSPYHV